MVPRTRWAAAGSGLRVSRRYRRITKPRPWMLGLCLSPDPSLPGWTDGHSSPALVLPRPEHWLFIGSQRSNSISCASLTLRLLVKFPAHFKVLLITPKSSPDPNSSCLANSICLYIWCLGLVQHERCQSAVQQTPLQRGRHSTSVPSPAPMRLK